LSQNLAVWLAPFDALPVHLTWLWDDATWLNLTWLWDDATWLDRQQWQASTPERPAGSMPCIVEIAGHWRLWISVSST
jgi:hypothetical protein